MRDHTAAESSHRQVGGTRTQREASAWESVFLSWPPAKPDMSFTRHVLAIARTMSAWPYSAISVQDGSRSATANSMRHRPSSPTRTARRVIR
jgi:hypothetical protein